MAGVYFHDYHPSSASLMSEVLAGLAATPKALPPKLFYDHRGAQLFERICELPEYYLTRTEIAILERHAGEMAALVEEDACLVELGSGAGVKVRLLLEHLRPAMYVPIDISRQQLRSSAEALAADYDWLEVHPVCADYCQPLNLDFFPEGAKRVAFFPGSTLGNFEPDAAVAFLANLRNLLGEGGSLLLSIDLKKEVKRIEAAYDDAAGVTAAFNLNILGRLQRDLDAHIDLNGFRHQAFYNRQQGRVEMHLISRRAQSVVVGGHEFSLDEGETIHTENSYKYSIEEFQALARRAGYRPLRVWTDSEALFSVHFLRSA
ncbi:MAG: L-histidine N(alpha)-methyltransferase [Gammaproteobacteria bacterium]|jgi:dimethylhistidine N-methyltransferase